MKSTVKGDFSRITLNLGDGKFVLLPPVKPPRKWYDRFVGRKVLPDVFEKKHGVNGYYRETPEYERDGVYLQMKVELDDESCIKDVSTYKEKTVECSGHYRPVRGRMMRLTKEDIKDFCRWLDELAVPLSELDSLRKPKTFSDYLPKGMDFDTFKRRYVEMVKCVRAGKVEELGRYRALVPYHVSSFPDVVDLACKRDDPKMVNALVGFGAGIPEYGLESKKYTFEVLRQLWRHIRSDYAITPIAFKGGLVYDQAVQLLKLNSKVHFHWTPELYEEFMRRNRPRLLRLIASKQVDMSPEKLLEADDLEGFCARLKNEDYAPTKLFEKGREWVCAVREKCRVAFDQAYGVVLHDAAERHDAKEFLRLAKLTRGNLPEYAFQGFDYEYNEYGDYDGEQTTALLDYALGRYSFIEVEGFQAGFVRAAFYWGSLTVCRRFLFANREAFVGDDIWSSIFTPDLIKHRDDDLYRDCVNLYLSSSHGERDYSNEAWLSQVIETVERYLRSSRDQKADCLRHEHALTWLKEKEAMLVLQSAK